LYQYYLSGFISMAQKNLSSALLSALLLILPVASQATDLEIAEIKLRTIQELYYLDGVVEAVNQSTLSSQTSGQVEAIYFDVNDYVEKDQVILVINDAEQQAGLKKAESELKSAKAGLQDASEEYTRTKDIFAKKLVAQSELDKASAILKKARANHESALAALDQAQKQLEYTQVKAPFAGIVTHRYIELGEIATPGKPLMAGISLEHLRVVVDVPQNLISLVRFHQKALVELLDQRRVYVDNLTIFPFAEKDSNTFKVRLVLPVAISNLLPGMFVKVAFLAGEKQELLVPASAVVYRSEVTGVYIDEQDSISFRHIRLGHAVDDHELIALSGLTENDKVFLDPVAAGALLKHQRNSQTHHE